MMSKILLAAAVIFLVGGLVYMFLYTRRVKRDGLDAEAVVTRYTVSTDGDGDSTYTWYVEYRTIEGETVEGMLFNPRGKIDVGRRMRIKYLPEKKNNPVFMEYL